MILGAVFKITLELNCNRGASFELDVEVGSRFATPILAVELVLLERLVQVPIEGVFVFSFTGAPARRPSLEAVYDVIDVLLQKTHPSSVPIPPDIRRTGDRTGQVVEGPSGRIIR